MTKLTDTIGLLYSMQADDVQKLQQQIEANMKRAYRETMTDNARAIGFNRAVGRDPSGPDLQAIREYSQFAAESIGRTWNRDSRKQIERLFEANRRGNRNYYFNSMEEWAARRAQWKNPQIALDIEGRARQTALDSFVQNNALVPQVALTGPPPREEVCAFLMSLGETEERIMREYPAPIHIGCPHIWEIVGYSEDLKVERVFVG